MSTVLITGANRGIGFEFARQYVADCWNVIATCRNPAKAAALQELAKAHPSVRIETLDVAEHAAIKTLADKLRGTAIDVLINNAGILSGAQNVNNALGADASQTLGTLDSINWGKVFLVNTIAPLLVAQEFLPHLERGAGKKIINISSRMGSIAESGSGHVAYRSSKAALNAAMRSILPDLRARDIIIVNFHPGWVKTDMGSSAAPVSPTDSVNGMRRLIASLALKDSGQFLGFDGTNIPW